MGNAITFRMPFGVQGDISRPSQATIEAQALNGALPFVAYGLPGKTVAGLIVPSILVGDTAPYGVLIRPYPSTGLNASDPLGTGVPATPAVLGPASILRRGYFIALLNAGASTAALGGQVYLRYANPSGAAVIGGLEGAAVGATTVALTNCTFMGTADATGLVEIGFNI